MLARALKYALIGAFIGGLIGWFGFGGTGYNVSTDNYGWGPIMAPIFVLIGAVVGLLDFVLVETWRAVAQRIADAANSSRTHSALPDTAEWQNPSNWTAGMFYKSSVDRRIFVPQKLPGGSFTINLGHPAGLAIGIVLLVVVVIAAFGIVK
jgi:uncharacterized membrane protein